MTKINKSSLQKAKMEFNEIHEYAQKAVKEELQEEINNKVNDILSKSLEEKEQINEDVTITISSDENIDVEEPINDKPEPEIEVIPSEEDESIEITQETIDEMEKNIKEQAPVAPETPAEIPAEVPAEMPAEPTAAPAEEVVEEIPKNDSEMIKAIYDKVIEKGEEVEVPAGQEVPVIEDEPTAAPAPAPAVEEPVVAEEDVELEFDLPSTEEKIEKIDDAIEGDEVLEIVDEDTVKEEEVIEIVPDKNEGEELEEMLGVSKSVEKTKHSTLPGKDYRTSRKLDENKKNTSNKKAQNESKIDELTKENKRLQEAVNEASKVINSYKKSFVDLRKQFDEMQTFNGKLSYALKIFAAGGLTSDEKAKITEDFDKAATIDEAKQLFNKIIAENNIKVNKDKASKLKAPATNAVKSQSEPLHENTEVKRWKELAGIKKA